MDYLKITVKEVTTPNKVTGYDRKWFVYLEDNYCDEPKKVCNKAGYNHLEDVKRDLEIFKEGMLEVGGNGQGGLEVVIKYEIGLTT